MVVGIVVITFAWLAWGRLGVTRPTSGQPAPAFSLQDFNGTTVRLEDFRGRPLVINSWAAWCPFCVQELKDFATVQQEFRDQVAIVAINRGEPAQTVRRFTDQLGVTDALVLLQDPQDSFYRQIGGFAMPETIFVDAQGKVVWHKRGTLNLTQMRELIRQLLR